MIFDDVKDHSIILMEVLVLKVSGSDDNDNYFN